MPRSVTRTREDILQAAFRQFRRKGFFRSGIDEIAEASHVTKRTLYNHFTSKDDLLAAVLEAQHERVFIASDPFGIGPRDSVGAFIDAVFRELVTWSSKPNWAGSGFTRLAVELADLPGHPARSIARRHKAAIEDYISGALGAVGVAQPTEPARQLILLIEGAMLMIMVHGDRSYADAAATAAKRLLLPAPDATVGK